MVRIYDSIYSRSKIPTPASRSLKFLLLIFIYIKMYFYNEKLEQFSFLTQHLPPSGLYHQMLTKYAILLVPKASSPVPSTSLLPKYSHQWLTKISRQLHIAKTNSLFLLFI